MRPRQASTALLLHSITPLLRLSLVAAIVMTTTSVRAETLRIGFQKAASTLVLLRAHGSLEKKLALLGRYGRRAVPNAGPRLGARIDLIAPSSQTLPVAS